jgi:hypothetical protein
MAVFWNVAPCSFVDIDRRFNTTFYLHHQSDEFHSTAFIQAYVSYVVWKQMLFDQNVFIYR